MKSLSDVLNRTPWWALVVGGFAVIMALAVFVTPFHLIEYRQDGSTPEEKQAIKREVDNTFAEGAMDIARSAIVTMRGATSDPARREELDRALAELDSARAELRDAGREVRRAKREVRRAKREAVDSAREAAREAAIAVEGARQSAEKALQEAGVDNAKVKQALEQSLNAAKVAQAEAEKALAEEDKAAEDRPRVTIGMGLSKDRPLLDVEVAKQEPDAKRRIEIRAPGDTDRKGAAIVIDLDDGAKAPAAPSPPAAPDTPAVPAPPLPPEVREQIRHNVSADLRKMGIGAALVLLFIPIFILTVVAKYFIDRSRAAQRLAELKRKEAEYHRMSQQVTEAKLMALQAQVEPHFLYNTLASVQALTEVDPARANTMVGHLIQYLRNALPKMRESISTVGQEVELVRAYLNILQMRMGRRLAFDISVPESLTATPFPPLMLPSLVENAIKHGLEPQREGGSVLISAQAQGGRLRLTVSDTGRGFGETVGAGVGLANIRERLAALYGETARLTLESNSPSGVIATIEVPLDGMRAALPAPPGLAGAEDAAAQPAEAKTTAAKVMSAVGTAERAWRKTLSFTFSALVIVGAVVTGLLMVGVSTGFIPMQMGSLTGVGGASIGVAGIAVAFALVVLALAVVVAIIYGLGWLFAGLAIFIPVVVLIATLPATAPFILFALFVWWLVRKKKGPVPPPATGAKIEPVMQPGPASDAPPPPPPPREAPPAG